MTKEQIQRAIKERGVFGAAKYLGVCYGRLLVLRKQFGLFVRHGSNQYNQVLGHRWTKSKPFDVIANTYYRAYRTQDKKRGHVFSLTMPQFKNLVAQECHYCGALRCKITKIQQRFYRSKVNGLDRVDNNKGHTLSNCVPCCSDCNYAKRYMTTNQFMEWLARVHKHLGFYQPNPQF